MSLNNIYFIIQFILLVIVMSVLQFFRTQQWANSISRIQLIIILIYSYFFILSIDWRFALCIAIITIIAYVCGILTGRSQDSLKSRKFAILGVILLSVILVYFKYTDFFIESFNKLAGSHIDTLHIILPLGISFYTFSAISYIIDIYRGDCSAENSILDFALYIAFFVKITAGPIVRWKEFKPQIRDYRGINKEAFKTGIQIFVLGLFKKMVLADHLGVFVDDVFRVPGAFDTGTVVLSAVSYSLQIYLDFSGYSDMAIGLSKILGFDFAPNFNLPYLARGFSDFWSRWHISLSQWFRDYLYIPLGGSKKGEARTYMNLIIVMLISGFWHGAGWTFILWGLLHGIACCVTRLIKVLIKNKGTVTHRRISVVLESIITFIFATLFWTIFRADSLEKAVVYWRALFTIHNGICQPYTWSLFAIICVLAATITACIKSYGLDIKQKRINGFYLILDLSRTWALVVFFTFIGLTVLFGYYGNTAFIYGNF